MTIDTKTASIVAFTVAVAAIVIMFGLTEDQATRDRLLGYFDTLIPFVAGAGVGAVTGGTLGFLRGLRSNWKITT